MSESDFAQNANTAANNNNDNNNANCGDSFKRVIIVLNVLPVKLVKINANKYEASFDEENIAWEDGGLCVGLQKMKRLGSKIIYVGVAPINVPSSHRDAVDRALGRINCHAVWVGAKEASFHFQGVCKSILWPAFHNVVDVYNESHVESFGDEKRSGTPASGGLSDSHLTSSNNNNNEELNEETGGWLPSRSFNPMEVETLFPQHLSFVFKFKRVIIGLYSEGDVVWLQDYHLLTLCGPLRRGLPADAPIAITQHIPFPASDIFRCISRRNDILESMLQANYVGFHSYEYVRCFLTTCQRMKGCTFGAQRGGTFGLKYGRRTITVSCPHAGLDNERLDKVIASLPPFVPGGFKNGAKIVISIDEVEGLRGIPLKLLAFDRALTLSPGLRNGRLVLKQIGLNLDSRPADYVRVNSEIELLVDQITTRWGPVIEYTILPSLSIRDRLAQYQNADIFFNSVVKWGLSADPFEFLAVNKMRAEGCLQNKPGVREPGVIIVSEFLAGSRALSGSIRVNPWSIEDCAKSIETAFKMPREERMARCFRDFQYMVANDVSGWGETVLRDISHSVVCADLLSIGLGSNMHSAGVTMDVKKILDGNKFAKTLLGVHEQHVMLIFDYSGTLVEVTPQEVFLKSGGQARAWHYTPSVLGERRDGGCLETRDPLSAQLVETFNQLTEKNPRLHLVVISQDLRDEVEFALRDVKRVTLVAENGYAVKHEGQKQWQILPKVDVNSVLIDNENWIEFIRQVANTYVKRCDGAFIFRAPSSVSFNFQLADPDLGEHQAKSLELELRDILLGESSPFVLERGKGQLTVRLKGIDRGAAITSICASTYADNLGFIACFGDDVEDEDLFRTTLTSIKTTNDANKFTVRVGQNAAPTCAQYLLHDCDDVAAILEHLANEEMSALPNSPTMQPKSVPRRNMSITILAKNMQESGANSNVVGFVTKEALMGERDRADSSVAALANHRQQSAAPVITFDDLEPAPLNIPSSISVSNDMDGLQEEIALPPAPKIKKKKESPSPAASPPGNNAGVQMKMKEKVINGANKERDQEPPPVNVALIGAGVACLFVCVGVVIAVSNRKR